MLDPLSCSCDVVWALRLCEDIGGCADIFGPEFYPIKQINTGWAAQCYKPRDLFCQINTDTSEPSQIGTLTQSSTHTHTNTHTNTHLWGKFNAARITKYSDV